MKRRSYKEESMASMGVASLLGTPHLRSVANSAADRPASIAKGDLLRGTPKDLERKKEARTMDSWEASSAWRPRVGDCRRKLEQLRDRTERRRKSSG